jgi:hypothetical protein
MTTEYSIIFEQDFLWDAQSIAIIYEAADLFGRQFALVTGLDLVTSFNKVFGNVRMWFIPNLKTHAEAKYSTIRFRNNSVINLALVIHEFAHLLGVRAWNKPTKKLFAAKLNMDGCSVYLGAHPPSLAGYNVVEQFCNLIEIWIFGLFSLTEAGVLCNEWVETNFPICVAIAMGRQP